MYIVVSKSSAFTLYMCLFAIRIGRRSRINLSFLAFAKQFTDFSSLPIHACVYTPPSHIAVIADVQRPKVCLETSQLHFEDAYVDIKKQFSTKLINTGLLPCYYSWSSQVHVCCVHVLCTCVYTLGLYDVAVHYRWRQHVACTHITLVVVNMLSLSCILLTMNGLVH